MTLGDFLRILRQRWGYVVGAVVGLLALAGTLTWLTEPVYESTSQVYISTSAAQGVQDLVQGSNFTQRQVSTYADLVTTPQVLEPVATTLGLPGGAEALERSLRAQEVPNTVLIDITASDPDPRLAADKANAVGEEFAVMIEELESGGRDGESPVLANVVRPARPADDPASPDVTRNLLIALLLGLVLGPVLALLREILDTKVRDEADVTALTDATILGRIGVDREDTEQLLYDTDPHSPRAEAFRKLRTNLQFIEAAQAHRSFVITSSLPGEGKTTTTLSLARTLAEGGSRVVVVDADLRRPRLLEAVGLDGSVGLTNLLIGELTVDETTQTWLGKVDLIGSGPIPPNPSELLGSPRMRELLEVLNRDYDYVLLDAPPLLPVTDAAILTSLTGGTIAVVGCGLIDREHVRGSLEILTNVEAPLVGLVLNRAPLRSSSPYAYRYYHQEKPDRSWGRGRLGRRRHGSTGSPTWAQGEASAAAGDPAAEAAEATAQTKKRPAPRGGRRRRRHQGRSFTQTT